MTATEILKKDHQLLRQKLQFLEAAMQVAPEAQFALREMCWGLAHLLDEHIKREEQVLAPYTNRIQAVMRYHLAEDHADQRVVLRDVNALLLGGIKTPVSTIVPPLAQLIEELREHMDEEEREVFPLIDRVAAETFAAPTPPPHGVITEEMTVNHVLKLHPEARRILASFKIDCDVDGCRCLDELKWSRGIDVEALLRALDYSDSGQAVAN